VQVVKREILAPLRHTVFPSLAALNEALAVGRERVNERPLQQLAGSRLSVFAATERAALHRERPAPARPRSGTAKINSSSRQGRRI
jgi:hypothetical protein